MIKNICCGNKANFSLSENPIRVTEFGVTPVPVHKLDSFTLAIRFLVFLFLQISKTQTMNTENCRLADSNVR